MTAMQRCGAGLVAGLIWLAVASGALAQGEKRVLPVPSVTINAGDIESRLAVVGQEARRTLLAGYPIPINAVEDVKIVKRGVPVRVVLEDSGLSIVTLGSPLQSAGVGAMVRVRNIDTGTIVTGIVQPDGSVRVSNT
jgi:flagella basal body P-ring formation protein FlgA